MEKNIKKTILAGICALSGAFILASCDPIVAVPTNYNTSIVKDKDGEVSLKDNLMGKIYDVIATDRNSKIVSDILDEIGTKKYGTYKEIQEAHENLPVDGGKTAKEVYIERHAKAFVLDGDDKFEGKTAKEVQEHRFDEFYKDIEERISEVFYNEIVSGSYTDDLGRFDEGKLWMQYYYDFFDLDETKKQDALDNHFYVDNTIDKGKIFEDGWLKGNYSNPEEGKRGYIEEKVFPQILKDKLVEDYVYETNPNALGRSYARKVSYIKVPYTNFDTPWKILKQFARVNVETTNEMDFEMVVKAIKGFESFNVETGGVVKFEGTEDAFSLLSNEKVLGPQTDKNSVTLENDVMLGDDLLLKAGKYYKDTKLGEIVTSWNKAIKAEGDRFAADEDKAEYDNFTANNKSKEHGLREKLVALAKEDYTEEGWYVKNGGLSDLPSALRDRLFNINVANTLDNGKLVLENSEATMGGYQFDEDGNRVKRLPYMRNIYGKKLVLAAKANSFDIDPFNYIYNDDAGSAAYIVQVLEAPSTPKLNLESATSYSKLDETKDDVFKTEDIKRQIAKVLGTKDSYVKDAYQQYLEGYTFEFYETSLYEHFKEEYPDLFSDED